MYHTIIQSEHTRIITKCVLEIKMTMEVYTGSEVYSLEERSVKRSVKGRSTATSPSTPVSNYNNNSPGQKHLQLEPIKG